MPRPGRDHPQFRPGGMMPVAHPPMNVPPNVPMNIPMNVAPPFMPPPMGGGNGYAMPHGSGAHFMYPPPPPTPVPSPHFAPFLPPLPAPSFVPPLPHSPPAEAPPPPPPPPVSSPSASPSHPLFTMEKTAVFKRDPLQLPAQPPKPGDPEILKNIEGMAEFVVRNGPRYESMARAKHAGDPKFTFLFENDSGLEGVVNRDFYKWKKEVFRLQAEAVAESKSQYRLDLQNDATQSELIGQAVRQREEIVSSPAMSDMDMEDDLVAPSPTKESPGVSKMVLGSKPGSPGRIPQINRVDKSREQKQTDGPTTLHSPSMSGILLHNEVSQRFERKDSPAKNQRAHCRLTGDYIGALIDNYMSDASEDSENSEPSASPGATGDRSPDHRKEGKVSDQSTKNDEPDTVTENVVVSKHSEAIFSKEVHSAEVQQLANDRQLDTVDGSGMVDIDDSKASDFQERIGEIRSTMGPPVSECDSCQAETLETRASSRTVDDITHQSSRKKSRSYSRSRSRSRSRSKSRSRSASPSIEDGGKSPSPTRSGVPDLSSRDKTLPKDLPIGVERVEYKIQGREKQGAKGGGSYICLNFVRGRCFRGDSCRFQHQGSDKGSDEVDRVQELEGHDILRNKASPQKLKAKKAVEMLDKVGPNAEVIASKKAKRKVEPEINDAVSEEEASKRSKLVVETVDTPPQKGYFSPFAASDPPVQPSAGGPSTAQQDEAASPFTPAADPLFSEVSHLSEATHLSPFSPSSSSRQLTGSLSQVPPFDPLGHRYPARNEAFSLQKNNPAQYSVSSGITPSNPYANADSEGGSAFGMKFSGGNHAQGHQPSSGIGENSQFQLYFRGSSVSGASTGSTLHDNKDLARSYAPSHTSDYGVSFQAQSGTSQNVMGPSSTFPPSFTAVRQPEHKGFATLQRGFSSSFSLPAQQHQSIYTAPFPGDVPRQSRIVDVPNHTLPGVYPQSALSSHSQNSSLWSRPGSLGNLSSRISEMQSVTVNSSSYSYALTTIPPLPSIVELPGTTKVSTASDQYDPLSDSFEPSLSGGYSLSFLKTVEEGKSSGGFPNTLASRLENVSPGLDLGKGDLANMNEPAGDPVVGIVENVSPPEDNRDWSPGQPVEAVETKQGQNSSKSKKNNLRGLKLLRSAVADHVKDVLKPTWKEGHMSKDAFKNIVKKAVDKVTAALPSHHIPKSQEKVDQFMSSSRMKIAKLVQGYIDKYQKA